MWQFSDWTKGEGEPSVAGAEHAVTNDLTGRILIVDDDPHFLRVLSRILTGENFQVCSATGVKEALDFMRVAQFDIVISDLRMPESDGLNLLQEVRHSGWDFPVIILTAYGEVDTYLEAMNAGAVEFLNKPIKSEELVKVVRTCLQSRNSRHANHRKIA